MYKEYTHNGVNYLEISSRRDISLYLNNKFGASYDILTFTFNGVVKISNGVVSARQLFAGCCNFNSPVILPLGLVSTEGMLSGCSRFNFPIELPSSVVNCSEMLKGCTKFNQPVVLPRGVTNCKRMLKFCTAFNQPIVVPDTVNSNIGVYEMLGSCDNMTSTIVFHNAVTLPDIDNCIRYSRNIHPKNIFTETASLEDIIKTAVIKTAEQFD